MTKTEPKQKQSVEKAAVDEIRSYASSPCYQHELDWDNAENTHQQLSDNGDASGDSVETDVQRSAEK